MRTGIKHKQHHGSCGGFSDDTEILVLYDNNRGRKGRDSHLQGIAIIVSLLRCAVLYEEVFLIRVCYMGGWEKIEYVV